MRKFCYISTSLLLFAIGCGRGFIDLAPISSVTIDHLFKTDKDFQDAVIGIYNVYQQEYQDYYKYGDIPSDDTWKEVSRNVASFFMDNFIVEPNLDQLNTTWRNYYSIINRANTVLFFIEAEGAPTVANRDRHIGEAKFLRALAYFNLVRIFGDVPLVTTPVTAEESRHIPRENKHNVYEFIINDLRDAGDVLPSQYSGMNIGRATKGAAKSLLGKVYLTVNDFATAETVLSEVITMGYALLSDFNDLFDYTKSEHHSEYVFDIEYEAGLNGEGSRFTNAFRPLSPEFNATFGITGGSDEDNYPTLDLFNAYEPHDLRRDITVDATGGFIDANGEFVPFLQASTYTRKYIASTLVANDSPANWKVIRYADVLLMYAEALNENGKTQEAITYLNQVRSRAGVSLYTTITQDEAREVIFNERRLELACEGHRWFDLLRTGRAYEILQDQGMRPHMTVFPIPLIQMQIVNNDAILWQNEGY